MRKGFSIILLVVSALVYFVGLVYADSTSIANDALLSAPNFTTTPYPIIDYSWDPPSFFGQFDVLYNIGNALFIASAFLTRGAIWFLNLGYNPSGWLSPMQQIADAIQTNHLMDRVLAFFALVAGFVILKDFFKRNMQQLMRRGITFLAVVIALLLFQGIGTAQYLTTATNAIDSISYAVSGWIMQPTSNGNDGSKTFEQKNTNLDKDVWTKLIENPWELGELGELNATIGKDADAVKTDITAANQNLIAGWLTKLTGYQSSSVQNIGPNTLWKNVILQYPPYTGPRKDFASLLSGDDHPISAAAFLGITRFLIGSVTLLSAIFADLFFIVMGLYLLGAHLIYLLAIVSGVFILPISLLPWVYSDTMLRKWIQVITGSVFIKIALSAYVGATFYVVSILTINTTAIGSSLLIMLLFPIVFVASLVILYLIQKNWRPVERITDSVVRRTIGDPAQEAAETYRRNQPENQSFERKYDKTNESSANENNHQRIHPESGGMSQPMKRSLARAGFHALKGNFAGAAVSLVGDATAQTGQKGWSLLKSSFGSPSQKDTDKGATKKKSERQQKAGDKTSSANRRIDPEGRTQSDTSPQRNRKSNQQKTKTSETKPMKQPVEDTNKIEKIEPDKDSTVTFDFNKSSVEQASKQGNSDKENQTQRIDSDSDNSNADDKPELAGWEGDLLSFIRYKREQSDQSNSEGISQDLDQKVDRETFISENKLKKEQGTKTSKSKKIHETDSENVQRIEADNTSHFNFATERESMTATNDDHVEDSLGDSAKDGLHDNLQQEDKEEDKAEDLMESESVHVEQEKEIQQDLHSEADLDEDEDSLTDSMI